MLGMTLCERSCFWGDDVWVLCKPPNLDLIPTPCPTPARAACREAPTCFFHTVLRVLH